MDDFEYVMPCKKCGYQTVQGDQCGNCGKCSESILTPFGTSFTVSQIGDHVDDDFSGKHVTKSDQYLETVTSTVGDYIERALESNSCISEIQEHESLDQLTVSCADETVCARFSIDFPLSVCRIITENISALERHVLPLSGIYYFEAGYDVIPEGCKLACPEQACSFKGTKASFLR